MAGAADFSSVPIGTRMEFVSSGDADESWTIRGLLVRVSRGLMGQEVTIKVEEALSLLDKQNLPAKDSLFTSGAAAFAVIG